MDPLAIAEPLRNDDYISRERWSRKIEFLFACVGFAVGYGNFWRFPFKALKNGGGAFLVPFILCLLLAGIPLFLMELSIGQYSQAGPLKTWDKVCPLVSGLGYAMVIVCALVSVYYNVILAWSCFYFFNSFSPRLPWVGCDHPWVSSTCLDPFDKENRNNTNTTFWKNVTSPSREFFVMIRRTAQLKNISRRLLLLLHTGAALQRNNVLDISSGIEATGIVNWKPMLCLLLSWILVYFCIWKGIRTTGKVVYVTATLPYLMLLVFFIQGLTLKGSTQGIKYYVTPVWEKLLEPQVWVDAASQVFYSLTLGFGVMLTFASYNKRSNNVYRDALIISITDALTSIFSGFVVFAIIGYMAEIQHKDIDDPSIATDGPGLVFIVYPAALATLPYSQVWSIVFFLMMITLGLDSQFGQVELICACIIEEYPRKLKKHKEWIVLAVCTILFLLGLLCTTQGGMYWFHLIDTYSAGSSLLFLGLIETVTIAWVYGCEKFRVNIEEMVGFRITYFWTILWKFISPAIIMGIFLFGLIKHSRLTYETTYIYPSWAEALGWLMSISSMICVPIVAVYKFFKMKGTLKERLQALTSSTMEDYVIDIVDIEVTEISSGQSFAQM